MKKGHLKAIELKNIKITLMGIYRQNLVNVSNSQGRNLGRLVTSARTSGLSSTQGMILGESG